ncbi:hypothetical protein PSTG_19971, partial [Puccinia striiformis f. sp. tritici PST-78]
KSIKRALVSAGKLPKGKDGSDQPPLWKDTIEAAETEIRVEENGGFSFTSFAESNYQMQKGLDQQKGGSQRRDRMIQELPTAKAVDKQVADMAQELASLKQQLRSLLPNRYNQTTSSNQQEYTRSNDRPSTTLYESAICYYCLRESHPTYLCIADC